MTGTASGTDSILWGCKLAADMTNKAVPNSLTVVTMLNSQDKARRQKSEPQRKQPDAA